MGKSALLAEYVRRNGCVAYFNVRSEGINRAEQFLESISIQLIEQYELDYPSLPVYAKQDGRFLGQLLQEVAVKSSEPVVIAIDALDEVSFDSQSAGANVLYLPRHLPHGIYIVLTKRSDVQVPFYVEAPQNVYDLMDENLVESNLQDIQAYIRHISHRDNIRHWIQSCELTVEEFINQLTVKSEYNFMYLYYVLRDISVDKYQDLSIEKLPVGLEGYYEDHWRRMGMLQTPLPRTKLKIIYVLVEVSHPVSSFLISDITKESKLTVQEVIDEWKQFLLEQNIDKQKCYSVYHASFSDFLYRKDIVQAADVMVDDINALIANDLWEGLYGND
ncbi:MAG: ATP-binding protein [Cyanobacteria bacterium J06649_11]